MMTAPGVQGNQIKIHLAAGAQSLQMQRVQNKQGDPFLCGSLLLKTVKLEDHVLIKSNYVVEK